MKKYKLMLTALLGAAFLFAPQESVNAAEPSDTISVSTSETADLEESEWLSGYHYELIDDGSDVPVVKLKKCYLSGDVSVPGKAAVGGTAYRTLVTKECFSDCAGITSLRFLEKDGTAPLASEDMSEAFSKDPYLESIDISGLDLSKTENINGMFSKNERLYRLSLSNSTLGTSYEEPGVTAKKLFSESPSITALDLSGFDTTNVVNMSYIFSSMQGVRSFRFGGSFDTSNVTDLSYAFYDCPSFTETLDLSDWNAEGKSSTSNNTTMRSMFELLPARAIVLTDFDTSNVTDMGNAFANTSFSRIDLSSFDTAKVTTMRGMFDGTRVEDDYLDRMTLGGRWNTSGVTDFSRMFNHRYITNSCANVFAVATKTPGASTLFEMFYDTKINCDADHNTLPGAALDLSGWNVSSVTDFRRFINSGSVSCNLTGWNYQSVLYGDNAFGGAASKATPTAAAYAIESKLFPKTALDDTSKYNCNYYGRAFAGLTKDGREFMKPVDSSQDTIHSLFGTTTLPIHYNVSTVTTYYIGDTYYSSTNLVGNVYTRTTSDTYNVSINRVQSPSTPEQERWFCPYNAGLTTNGQEDRYYYEIYGYCDGRLAFKYAPTQSEWNETVKHCVYSGTINGFKSVCNEGNTLINRVYGFKQVDISEYLGNVQIQTPTVENGGLDLTGESGTDYSAEYEEGGMPFSNLSYVVGKEKENIIRPVEKKNFVFLGWFDTDGNDLTDYTGGLFTPSGLSSEIIVPHYKVKEKSVNISVVFDAGESAPGGLSLSLAPGAFECFSLSREGNKWSGTFSTMVGPADKTFKLPVLSIEGMDEEDPEYEFLGWEGGEDSFTVTSADTEKSFKAVFRHNEKTADDPGTDDPTTDEPGQDDPKQDEPKQDEPKQDEPKQDEPKQDEPKQDEPKQDDPAADEPKQDEPKQDEPKQDEPKQDEPKQDEPKQDEPKQDEPKQDEPKQDEPKQDEPKQDEPKQDEPKQDEPKQDEPKQDEPKQDEPKQDEPKQDEPKQDEPKQDEPKQDEPKQDEPKQDEPKQDEPRQDQPSSEMSESIKALNDELTALREEKAQADAKNTSLVDSLNKKIAELENAISTLSSNMSKNDEVPASTERGENSGSGSSEGRNASGGSGSSYGQETKGQTGSGSSNGSIGRSNAYSSGTSGTSANTSSRAAEGENISTRVYETPSVSGLTSLSSSLSRVIAQPEPHYAYKASNGKTKLNYDTSVSASSKDTVEEYGFFTEDKKQDMAKTSSAKSASEKAALSSDEMKKAAGNTGTHDGGLLEAQNIGRSIFGVMILVIITGCAIFFTFRKKAVKKNRRSRK